MGTLEPGVGAAVRPDVAEGGFLNVTGVTIDTCVVIEV
jgi:hypothetical protein